MEGDLIRINPWLYPLAWIYGWVVSVRNYFFDCGVLESKEYDIPIISVGNITVGGTGKTPHIEHLVRLLSEKHKVAVLSRGYKRKSSGYILAHEGMTAEHIGDEPWQMMQKFPDVYIAVDADRRRGIERLMNDEATRDVEIILLDDAFQHRYVTPGCNILLTDYHRLFTKDEILPAGRLREPAKGKERANMVIVSKCPRDMSPMDYRIIAGSLDLRPYQQLYFTSFRYGRMVNLATMEMKSMKEMKENNVLLLTGIGCPQHMTMDLSENFASVKSLSYPDHHYYSMQDLQNAYEKLAELPEPRIMITTEKDATRLMALRKIPEHMAREIWVLPAGVHFLQDKDQVFNEKITGYVQKNLRNRRLAEGQTDNEA